MAKVDISIVICTRNRAESLKATLVSLAGISVPHNLRCELIVVDNGSTDRTSDVVRQTELPEVPMRLVDEPQPGLSRARNRGLAEARGDVLVFTDDDVRVPADWIERLIEPLWSGHADAAAGAVRLAAHLERPWMRDRHRAHLADTSRLAGISEPELVGANMAFTREVLRVVPAFDTELGAGMCYAGEETLFSKQLLAAGYRIALADGEAVEHHMDEKRLKRECFLIEVGRSGRFFAYLDHHWEHCNIGLLALRDLRSRARLASWRALHPKERRRDEGIEVREMEYVFAISYFAEIKRLKGTPRNYGRRGLVKRGDVSSSAESLSRAA